MILTREQIFANKQEARKRLRAMSFVEKIRLVERMKGDLAPLRRLRATKQDDRPDGGGRPPA